MATAQQQPPTEQAIKTPSWKSRLAPAISRGVVLADWAKENRIKASVVGLGLTITAAVLAWLVVAHGTAVLVRSREESFELALDTLKQGSYVQARQIVDALSEDQPFTPDELARRAYVRGAAAAHEAESAWIEQDRRRNHLIAAKYLEEARDRGLPAEYRADGLFLLGKSLVSSGRYAASRPILHQALKLATPAKKTQIHRLLLDAYYFDSNPDNSAALKYSGLYLADAKITEAQRHEALLRQAQILLRMKQWPECRKTLGQIPNHSKNISEVLLLQGRLLMQEARHLKSARLDSEATTTTDHGAVGNVTAKYDQAIAQFRRAQARDTKSNQTTQKAMYLIGVCLKEKGEAQAAISQFARTHKFYLETPEGLAASLAHAELLRQIGEDDSAIAEYRRVFSLAKGKARYSNPWVSLDDFRRVILNSYQQYNEAKKYQHAIELTGLMYPILSRPRSVQLAAEAHAAWASDLIDQAKDKNQRTAAPLKKQARAEFRKAGSLYGTLAKLRIATRKYPQDVRIAARNFLAGHDYASAVRYLKRYLENEARTGRPEALVGLGEALLARGQAKKALEPLSECIESYPRDASSYRARLLAAQAHQVAGNISEATRLLNDNLIARGLKPKSAEWRDSLFLLGRLLYGEGGRLEAESRLLELQGAAQQAEAEQKLSDAFDQFTAASVKLDEAIERFPSDRRTIQTRYLLAESYRQSAKYPRHQLQRATIGQQKLDLSSEIGKLLRASLVQYRELQLQLNRRLNLQAEGVPLGELEMSILRITYFSQGDIYFGLNQDNEAIAAYKSAANRYQNRPEVLTAYFQIAAAYRRLGDPYKAAGALKRAELVLKRIEAKDPAFLAATSLTREDWRKLLNWMIKKYQNVKAQ